ncbi:hypothetical protein [Segetibacter koreensis]|uniref:hypothetical protein n=1 Tax=Segetibacter koreensis TaxID=398037 RepID=UPI0012FA6D0B|nr:hypothetical protein [Segetibacter koreensis]
MENYFRDLKAKRTTIDFLYSGETTVVINSKPGYLSFVKYAVATTTISTSE